MLLGAGVCEGWWAWSGWGWTGVVLGKMVPSGLAFLMQRGEAMRMEKLLGCPFLVQDLSRLFEKLLPCMGGHPNSGREGPLPGAAPLIAAPDR